jgi:hypothetical protein
MIKRVLNIRKEVLFRDQERQLVYRRVVGAVGWPWEPKPGFLVVIGEQYAYDHGLKGRPLQILAEREVTTIAGLHQGCMELRNQCACDTWLADLGQKEALRLFRNLNRGLSEGGPEPVWLTEAPYSQGEGQLQTLFQMLGMVQSQERKLLSYGPESTLPGYAMGLDQKDLKQAAGKFPALAALGYAVAELILREPWSGGSQDKRVITEWDLYA